MDVDTRGLSSLPGRKWSDPAYRTPEKIVGIFDGISKLTLIFIYYIQAVIVQVMARAPP